MDTPRAVSLLFVSAAWRTLGVALGFGMGVVATPARAAGSEAFFDRIEQALTFGSAGGNVRARLGGTLDLEAYRVDLPAPALIETGRRELFNPRLALFLDAQLGTRAYVFAQARLDRGFDPGDRNGELRLDEYALRFQPGRNGRFILQAGKFATVVGNWTARHASWTNPFVNAPLPYENLTGIWDSEPARSAHVLLQWSHVRAGLPAHVAAIEKSLRIPIVWGPGYTTGAAVAGALGGFSYALEAKQASLSSRPETWGRARDYWRHPTVSGRLGYQPGPMWTFGVSASAGTYLRPEARAFLPAGQGLGDHRQLTIAHDLAFAWRHVQVWAEIYAARFEVPAVGDADTVAYYAEARYKFTPQFSGAVRWNQQLFGSIADRGVPVRWGRDTWRLDLAAAYRFSPHTQLKLQFDLQHGDSVARTLRRTVATQFTVRF